MRQRPYIPAVGWALVILILTLTPGKYLPHQDYWTLLSVDKYIHFSIFFIQVWLLLWAAARSTGYLKAIQYLFPVLFGTGYGIMIEFIQTVIPQRSFDIHDMVANTFGAIFGALI